MNDKESLKIKAIARKLNIRSDVTWIREIVKELDGLANKVDYRICPKCKGVGLLEVKKLKKETV